jgi:uncharacterized protein (TIGR00251 family)
VIPLQEGANGASFAVKVQPRARRNAVVGAVGDALKVAVTAAPEQGRANEAVCRLLTELLNLPASSVTIAAGATGRNKRIHVARLSAAQVRARLAARCAP